LPGKVSVRSTEVKKLKEAGLASEGASSRKIAVAFCSDSLMKVPLHVAVASLLTHLSPSIEPHFYLLVTGFSDQDKDDLRRTMDVQKRNYRLTFLSNEKIKKFRRLPSLHGSSSIYYRLLLPDLIDEPRILYLDADTLPIVDLAPLFTCDMRDYVAGFVVDGSVESSLERTFFLKLGRSLQSPLFNSGVMLLNPPEWRNLKYWDQVLEFLDKYGTQLLSHDQTVLNALFAENCFHLDPSFNIKVYPRRDASLSKGPGIYHFLGSPKPWDLGGRVLFPHAKPWFDALDQTALPLLKRTLWLNSSYWKRAPRIVGGYKRMLRSARTKANRFSGE
jgi:lipopolysaccharide biosynthesis glycosyltransferase